MHCGRSALRLVFRSSPGPPSGGRARCANQNGPHLSLILNDLERNLVFQTRLFKPAVDNVHVTSLHEGGGFLVLLKAAVDGCLELSAYDLRHVIL